MKIDTLPNSFEEMLAEIQLHGPTDTDYLRAHFHRFRGTVRQFLSHWSADRGTRILDIGAHWLHQAFMLSKSGFSITAGDFPATLGLVNVKELAKALEIDLLIYHELHTGNAFESIEENSIDVVFFTEILEHITFNPVAFWKSIYRVLKPGGRIVLTTPNFYRKNGRAWEPRRFLSGFGSGIRTTEILQTLTYGHHWKEFSRKEVCHYFCSLSPDFNIHRALLVDDHFIEPVSLFKKATSFVLPQLYVEIDLVEKTSGVVIDPSW